MLHNQWKHKWFLPFWRMSQWIRCWGAKPLW